jgi:hypothetical protein
MKMNMKELATIDDVALKNIAIFTTSVIMSLLTFATLIKTKKIVSIPILISDGIILIWRLNNIQCSAFEPSNMQFTANDIFNDFIIYFIRFLMMIYAIHRRDYIATIWTIMPTAFEFFKGFSCGIELVLRNN